MLCSHISNLNIITPLSEQYFKRIHKIKFSVHFDRSLVVYITGGLITLWVSIQPVESPNHQSGNTFLGFPQFDISPSTLVWRLEYELYLFKDFGDE